MVTNQVRDLAWKVDHEGVRRMTPEGLYGRRKMTALVQRSSSDSQYTSITFTDHLADEGIRPSIRSWPMPTTTR